MVRTLPLQIKKIISVTLLVVFLFSDVAHFLIFGTFVPAHAAEVQIDDTVSRALTRHIITGSASVFISDQVGYKFYVDRDGRCVYRKTINGGTSWGTTNIFDTQTNCASPVVWYDQWTPGATTTFIHIVTLNPNNNNLWYNRLDTSTDTLLLGTNPVNVTGGLGYAGTLTAGANKQAITRGTDGTIYVGVSDNNDSIIAECSISCENAGNWTEMSGVPLQAQNDYILLLPQPNGHIMLIRRDISAEDLQSQIWNNSTWPGLDGYTTFEANARDNTTYDSMMAAVVNDDFEIFIAYLDALNYTTSISTHDVRTAKYSGGTWSNTTDVVTDFVEALTNVSIGLDANTDDVYVAYSGRSIIGTAASANLYWASSTSAMSSWSSQQGPVNSTTERIAGVDINHRSNERIYVSWYGETTDAMFGDTLADVTPAVIVSATGTQIATIRASSSPQHLGGTFVIAEKIASRNVTSITLTETGTIDAATGIGSTALYYDLDTSLPYDCASESYDGTESQFGSTDLNGFSAQNGVAIFTDIVAITPTQALCLYVVTEVVKAAADGSTLAIEISNPEIDVVVSGAVAAVPNVPVALPGSTNIVDDTLTQTHFHFRNDDGSETTATSRTAGVQDTNLNALQKETPVRLRFGVSNVGSTSTFPTTLQLEYAPINGTCEAVESWTDIAAVDDDWNLFDSTHLTDATDSTDIGVGMGGVDNENSIFLTPNAGVRDTTSSLGSLTFLPTNWTEAEFSIVASSTAVEGQTYCFRLSDNGTPIDTYSVYPRVTISADVRVRATGTQIASVDIPATNVYLGGVFTITENSSSRSVTSITLTEVGTVDAANGLDNIRLYYDLDTTVPYDCASESYDGTEALFGVSDTDGFSSANGTSTFTDSVTISTTTTLCLYPVVDVTSQAQNGNTIDLIIQSGSNDITVAPSSSISPPTTLDITGSTTLNGSILTQFGYHWRNDNGSEITASSSVGAENTPVLEFSQSDNVRLRMGVSNEGATTSVQTDFNLQYGIKITTCDAISVWTDVDATADAWDAFPTSNLTEGADTTDVATTTGGLTNPGGKSFLALNGGVRDTTATVPALTLSEDEFSEFEFSLTSTATTSFDTAYCFRLVGNDTPLPAYTAYAELTTAPKRDFKVQRGITTFTGTNQVVTAGVNYDAPASTSLSFVRITNMHHTGAGRTVGDNTQEANITTAYISNPQDLATSFTITRVSNSAIQDATVAWEIVEFIGELGTENEMIVREQSTIAITGTNQIATGTAVTSVVDDSKVVVFITGSSNANTGSAAYFNGQVTARWNAATNEPIFERIGNGSTVNVSYAVVEYTGINWKIQRIEHTYNAVDFTEIESIEPVNSLSRAFLHTQKRVGALASQANYGHLVWLSSIGYISFRLAANATTSAPHVSVAWVIENMQTSEGAMKVQQSSGSITGGATEPRIATISLTTPVSATNNTSLFPMSAFPQATNNYPRVLGRVTLLSTTAYEIFQGERDATVQFFYQTDVVEWPTTGLAIRQNFYRFYTDNDALTPTDPWPLGAVDIGENTPIGALDEPPAEGDRLRLRLSLTVSNATLPAGIRSFKLQFAARPTSCSAVETWTDLGAPNSGAIWRGFDTSVADGAALGGNPPAMGELKLEGTSIRAGRFSESNPSVANPFDINDEEDVEYDWAIEHNGALGSTIYCFRMVQADGTPLDGYNFPPQVRTAGFTPVMTDWRWYDDEENETPSLPLAAENTTPIDIAFQQGIALRLAVNELKNVDGNNIKFKLQFSETTDFIIARDVVSSASCEANSLWCYVDGGGVDNAVISAKLISSADSCSSSIGTGCGTHNASADLVGGFVHQGDAATEYSFTIKQTGARANAVYYFRLYDVTNDQIVSASSTYPSLVVEGPQLVFTISGMPAGTITEGITADVSTTPSSVAFGSIPINTEYEAVYRLQVDTTATEGYKILMYTTQPLINSYGDPIPFVTSTNAAPAPWSTACPTTMTGCFGYHTGDDILEGGSTRFLLDDTYAAFSTSTLEEIMFSSVPTEDTLDIVFKAEIRADQPAGDYQTEVVYVAIPSF